MPSALMLLQCNRVQQNCNKADKKMPQSTIFVPVLHFCCSVAGCNKGATKLQQVMHQKLLKIFLKMSGSMPKCCSVAPATLHATKGVMHPPSHTPFRGCEGCNTQQHR